MNIDLRIDEGQTEQLLVLQLENVNLQTNDSDDTFNSRKVFYSRYPDELGLSFD